jgi:hypothetical protein
MPHPVHDATWPVDDGDEVLFADGTRIRGWIDEDVLCEKCGAGRVYHMDFDAYFCPGCNLWLEAACDDPSCSYCPGRPTRPLAGGADFVGAAG